MKEPQTIAERLAALRERKSTREGRRITQVEVADAVGVVRSTVAAYENGHDAPGRETLAAFADYYDVPLDYLRPNGPALADQASDNVAKNADELSMLRMLRLMDEGQVKALRAVADQLTADRRRSGS